MYPTRNLNLNLAEDKRASDTHIQIQTSLINAAAAAPATPLAPVVKRRQTAYLAPLLPLTPPSMTMTDPHSPSPGEGAPLRRSPINQQNAQDSTPHPHTNILPHGLTTPRTSRPLTQTPDKEVRSSVRLIGLDMTNRPP